MMPREGTCPAIIAFEAYSTRDYKYFVCELPKGHEGAHSESGVLYAQTFQVLWFDVGPLEDSPERKE